MAGILVDLGLIQLVEKIKSPYTTRGIAFGIGEADLIDQNFTTLGDFIIQMQTESVVPEYDDTEVVDNGFIRKSNGKIFLQIFAGSPSTSVGVPPGVTTHWCEISIGWLAHLRNTDTFLDQFGSFEVTAEEIFNIINNGTLIKPFEKLITNAQVLLGNSVPVEAIPLVNNRVIEIVSAFADIIFDESSPGGTPYTHVSNNITLIHNGADQPMWQCNNFLNSTKRIAKYFEKVGQAVDNEIILESQGVNFFIPGSNPSLGTSALRLYGTFREVTLIP